jgi:hypothetical protein
VTAVRKEWKKRRPFGRWVILAVLALGLTVALSAASGQSLPGSKFEIDDVGGPIGANLIVDTAGNLDWANVDQTQATDLPTGATDDSYQGGTKEDTVCPGVVDGSIPNNKSDLLNFGGYFEAEAGGPGWLHVFWRRVQEPNGTTNMDFEFNKSKTDCDGAGSSKNVTRTTGDILLQYDIDQGGSQATLSKRTWLASGQWSDATVLDPAQAIGSINQVPITAANSDGLGAMSARTFGEASFDLSQVFDPNVCESFGSAMLKSRSSDSFTSQLKDFIAPINVNISNCGQVIIRKVTDPAGSTASFNYSKTFATAPATANTFSLTGAAPNNVKEFPGALFGAGTVTEDLATLPAGWEFVSLDCSASSGVVVTVNGAVGSWTIDAQTDIVDCTYTNRLRQGAIKITKTRKHAAGGGTVPHAGVDFTVNGVTKATDANGQACFDGLTFALPGGTSYDVTETLPSGYHADGPLTKAVIVDNNATCADNPYGGETVAFSNSPLTNLSVSVDSQIDGGTASTIDCDDDLTDQPVATGANGDGSKNIVDLEPGTYTCVVVIDP